MGARGSKISRINITYSYDHEKNFANMKEILEISLNNLNKTLQDVYERQHGITTFSEFIELFIC